MPTITYEIFLVWTRYLTINWKIVDIFLFVIVPKIIVFFLLIRTDEVNKYQSISSRFAPLQK